MYIHVQQDKTSTFKKIFYSINPSIFLQNDKYSNTNYIWQQTTEYLIDILHVKSAVLHGPIPPRYAAVFFKIDKHGELLRFRFTLMALNA